MKAEDIIEIIKDSLNSPKGQLAKEVVSIQNPVVGAMFSICTNASKIADEYCIKKLLEGLLIGLNEESLINRLYTYAKTDSNKAFYVANTCRKALMMDSPIAITLMGLILSIHCSENTDYSVEDQLICRALNAVSDIELIGYWKEFGKIETNDFWYTSLDTRGNLVYEWALYNHFMYEDQDEKIVNNVPTFYDGYRMTDAGLMLIGYMKRIRQVFQYSD